jgi:hypothetical protein
MAEAMTYDSLVEDIQVYAERDDTTFVDYIPRFIMLAENRLATTIRGLGYLQIVNGTMTAQNPVFQKPNRWRETASISIVTDNGRVYLQPREYEFCRAYTPVTATYGQPRYYADYGYENFLVAMTPDEAYPFELSYFERPEPLDTTNQTSWTTQFAPQLLLYSSLLEAQPFLMNNDKLALWKSLYEEAAAQIAGESTRRQVDHTIIRSPE